MSIKKNVSHSKELYPCVAGGFTTIQITRNTQTKNKNHDITQLIY